MPAGELDTLDERVDGLRRNHRVNHLLSAFLEQPGEAPLILLNVPAGRIGRRLIDTGQRKRAGVGHAHVPTGALDEYRIIGRRAVELFAQRMAFRIQVKMIVAPTDDPFAG